MKTRFILQLSLLLNFRIKKNHGSITYRIVGPDELEPKLNYISVDSTLSHSLLGKTLGDSITVKTKAGCRTYKVIAIRYENTRASIS